MDHRLAIERRELRDDVGPRLPGDQDAAHRARVADPERRRAALSLCRVAVREIGAVAFLRVNHGNTRGAEAFDQPRDRRNDRLQQADVVAETRAEAARLDEVALHVDDDERGRLALEAEGERLGGDLRHQ